MKESGEEDGVMQYDVLEIGGKASANARLLRRRVDTNEYEVRLADTLVYVRREEQVAAARLADDVLQARLVDREIKVLAVPRVDARLVQVDDGDRDMRALERNDRTRRATCGASVC